MWMTLVSVLALAALQSPASRPALSPDLLRAQQHDRAGWTRVDGKDFGGAADEFGAALQIYAEYADALYGLGKARMGLHEYDAAARALERSRDSYIHAGTQDAEHRLLANRAREDQIRLLRQQISEIERASAVPGSGASPASTYLQELKQQVRDLEGDRDHGPVTGQPAPVPSFVSLALGSAYFRLDRIADAERAFRAAIAVDPKFGEAHSNLALVCLLTGRAQEAQAHVRIAEEAKFTINPELKRQIRDALARKKSGGPARPDGLRTLVGIGLAPWASRRPPGKAQGARIPGVCKRRATQPGGMPRRPRWQLYSDQGPNLMNAHV